MFPFGFGLSYTTFQYGGLQIVPAQGDSHGTVAVTFQITNTGAREGAETAEVFVADKHAKIERPVKELKGFAKVNLKPGETRPVTIQLDRRAFAYYDVVRHQWTVVPGTFDILVGGSAEKIFLQGKVNLSQ